MLKSDHTHISMQMKILFKAPFIKLKKSVYPPNNDESVKI